MAEAKDIPESEMGKSDILLKTLDPKTGKPVVSGLNPDYLKKVEEFPVHEEDVYLCGFPKSGNMWTATIINAIMMQDDLETFQQVRSVDETRLIELFPDEALKHPHPGFFFTHVQYPMLPKAIGEKKPKIVYVTRNPKDVAVSLFYFQFMEKNLMEFAKPWDEFFEEFINPDNTLSYFSHMRSFWPQRVHPHIFHLKYEDLQKDPRKGTADIAAFMGKPLSVDKLDKIVQITEFNNMKNNPNLNPSALAPFVKGSTFMRKGQVGDWTHLFTEDQQKRLDDVYSKLCEEIGRA